MLPCRDRPRVARAAASAIFLPVVLFLIPLNDVVANNIQELPYTPALMRWFFYAGVVLWAAGIWVTSRFGGRLIARLWVTLPWAVLILDVVGAFLERRNVSIAASAAADAAVLVLIVVAAMTVSWPRLATLAAVVGVALFVQGVWAHETLVRKISADAVLGANRDPRGVPDPGPDAPGNVYHILLDDYLSESFAYSTGPSAAQRYPGFTYFTRFNTNFPRTESSEPAMIAGRFPTAGMSIANWPATALRTGFWKDLAASNVGMWIYPYGRWLCPDYVSKCLSSFDIERDAQTWPTRRATVDLWALRLFPASLRRLANTHVGAYHGAAPEDSAGFSVTSALRGLLDGTRGTTTALPHAVSALPTQYFNLKLFDVMLADEPMRPAHGQYVYYHALVPHPPYIMNERCEYVPNPTGEPSFYWSHVACANLMIDRLVTELRRLGRLDDALIVVHADHGDMEFLNASKAPGHGIEFALDSGARRYQQADSTYTNIRTFDAMNEGDSAAWRSMAVDVFSSGLLLTKFPHASQYSQDARPVQLLDIAPTVLSHFGVPINREYAGEPISSVPESRDQMFFAHSRTFGGDFSKYRLTDKGWVFTERIPVTP
jgi:hypothetical protein